MVINYSISFQMLDQYIRAHNELQEGMKTRIRQGMSSTAKELIKIYGVSLLKAQKIQELSPDALPTLRSNNQQLATLTGASSRTIQRHVNRLLEAKILLKKQWHGSHSSYELWINPKILWINGHGAVNKSKNDLETPKKIATDTQSFISEEGTKCPHSYTYKKTIKKTNILIAVDKLKTQWQVPIDAIEGVTNKKTENTKKERNSLSLMTSAETEKKTGNTQKKEVFKKNTRREEVWRSSPSAAKKDSEDKDANVCAVTPGENFAIQTANFKGCDATRHTLLTHYVQSLWKVAINALYDPKTLTHRQANIGKALLYQWYEPVVDEKLEKVHLVYLNRIELVQKYLEKDPEHRYVQLPYRYFDPQNPHGFAGTKPWYEAEKAYKTERNLQKIVRDQIRKFQRNEELDTSEARPRLSVFRECEQRIGKLGIPALLQQFYKTTFQPKTE